jgi:hypothetical protein
VKAAKSIWAFFWTKIEINTNKNLVSQYFSSRDLTFSRLGNLFWFHLFMNANDEKKIALLQIIGSLSMHLLQKKCQHDIVNFFTTLLFMRAA